MGESWLSVSQSATPQAWEEDCAPRLEACSPPACGLPDLENVKSLDRS